jgi:hypothetical protein
VSTTNSHFYASFLWRVCGLSETGVSGPFPTGSGESLMIDLAPHLGGGFGVFFVVQTDNMASIEPASKVTI